MEADTRHQSDPCREASGMGTNRRNNEKRENHRRIPSEGGKPPPLPDIPSSSDIYTKKIASFKNKLKTLKGLSLDLKGDKAPKIGQEENTQAENASRKDDGGTPWDIATPRAAHPASKASKASNTVDSNKPPQSSLSVVSGFHSTVSEMQIPARKLAKENKCCICGIDLDTFYNIQDTERIFELVCGHMVHEECLSVELELNLSLGNVHLTEKNSMADYFPLCLLCSPHRKTIPKNEKVLNDIYTRVISLNIGEQPNTVNNSILSLGSPSTPIFSDDSKYLDTENSQNSSFVSNQRTNLVHLLQHDLLGHSPNKQEKHITSGKNIENREIELADHLKSIILPPYKTHSKKPSRGSHISGTSAIVSSVDNDNGIEGSQWSEIVSNNSLKQKLITDLISLSANGVVAGEDDSDFILTEEFVNSLGTFRIVDKIQLLECKGGLESQPIEHYCYLFDHMLLALNSITHKFNLININLTTFVDSSKVDVIILKTSKASDDFYKLSFNSVGLKTKWNRGLTDWKHIFAPGMVTSSVEPNEFDHLIESTGLREDEGTVSSVQSYIGDDGYKRLPTGVCPRFYEETINSLIFKEKPIDTVIILNQTQAIPNSIVAIKNIVRSLSLIGINVYLILCSTSALSMNSNVIYSCQLNREDLKTKGDTFMSNIDEFEDHIKYRRERIHETNIADIMTKFENTFESLDNSLVIVMSNASLSSFTLTSVISNILIEIGLDFRQKSNRPDVTDLASWDDIMEVICLYCGLEFDESDFYLSSDSDDSDFEDESDRKRVL